MKLYDKINDLCDRNGITRKQMCFDIGLSYATLNSMMARKSKNITLTALQNIAKYFNVTLDYLVDDNIIDPNYGKVPLEIKQSEYITPDTPKVAEAYDKAKPDIQGAIRRVLLVEELKEDIHKEEPKKNLPNKNKVRTFNVDIVKEETVETEDLEWLAAEREYKERLTNKLVSRDDAR